MDLNYKEVERIIRAALTEDIGKGDVTAELLIPASANATLHFVNREPIIACGLGIVPLVFAQVNVAITTDIHAQEGGYLSAHTHMITAHGPAHAILSAERTALNLLQRMSAVATLTSYYVEAIRGTKAIILDTRKTMPGLRELDKYAVRTGGGRNHRMRLDDGILIKDNHIAVCGSVTEALKRAQANNPRNLPLEIECDTLVQVQEALDAGAKAILLDNMDLAQLREAVQLSQGRATLEASGNVSLDTARSIAETGVDFISVGKITHSAPNVDIGLDMVVSG